MLRKYYKKLTLSDISETLQGEYFLGHDVWLQLTFKSLPIHKL